MSKLLWLAVFVVLLFFGGLIAIFLLLRRGISASKRMEMGKTIVEVTPFVRVKRLMLTEGDVRMFRENLSPGEKITFEYPPSRKQAKITFYTDRKKEDVYL